jgi:cytoskeletal protein RodZ
LPPPSPVIVPPPPTLSNAPLSQRPSLTLDPSPIKTDILPKAAAPAPVPGKLKSPTSPTFTGTGSSPSSAKEAPAQSKTPRDLTTPPPLPTNFPSLNPTPSPAPNLIDPAVPPPASGTRSATPSAESAPAGNAADSKLSDTIPQVAEARNYFQQRWKPPAELTQTLEYSLTLDTDGSIQRILPLGKAAGEYIDSTGIPRPGDRFVSPVAGGGNPIIRVVLTPDGKVQTFLE